MIRGDGRRPSVSSRKQGRAFWTDEEEKLDHDSKLEKFGVSSESVRRGFAFWFRPVMFAAVFVYVATTAKEFYENGGAIPRRGVLLPPSTRQ